MKGKRVGAVPIRIRTKIPTLGLHLGLALRNNANVA
jgi:hypothetical protein